MMLEGGDQESVLKYTSGATNGFCSGKGEWRSSHRFRFRKRNLIFGKTLKRIEDYVEQRAVESISNCGNRKLLVDVFKNSD